MVQLIIQISPGDGAVAEWTIIELQGDLECKSQSTNSNGKFIGDLLFTKKGEPTLIIGHHIMVGKLVQLDKPLAVLVSGSTEASADLSMEHQTEEDTPEHRVSQTKSTSANYIVQAIVKKKIVFKTRPKPIISNIPKKL